MDKFIYDGYTFALEIDQDQDMSPPWEEYDGTGVVSDWTRRDKKPCERLLCQDRGSKRFYNIQSTIEKATKEGWGLGHDQLLKLTEKLKRTPTRKEIIAEAVERDFDYLRRWCNNEWYYAVLHVTLWLEDEDGDLYETEHEAYLGGVECDWYSSDDYVAETAREMASECLHAYRKANAWQIRQDLCTTI